MELRQLEYLVTVVDEAGFTRAAAKLHVAQSGISAQIRRLEREFGQPLLDRSERRVRPTQAGAAVLPYVRAALGAVASARLAVDEMAGLVRGHLTVGMVGSCASIDLPEVLAEFQRRYPGVELTASEASSEELCAAVRAGQLDVAFATVPGEPPPGLAARVVADVPLVVAVSHDHPLAARGAIDLAELWDQPVLVLTPGTGLRATWDEACAEVGIRPRIAFEASDPSVLARFAAHGLGVAVLPESVAAAHRHRLRAVTLVRPRLRGRIVLIWRARHAITPAARALVDHVRATPAP